VKKAEGRLWWQRAARGGRAIGHALQDLADWAINRTLPDLPGLDDPADFAEAAQGEDRDPHPGSWEPVTGDAPPASDPPPGQQPEPDRREPIEATATRLDEQPPPQPPVDGQRLPKVAGQVVCDGGATCHNSNLGPIEAMALGLCPGCGGHGELVWNFGGEHGHTPCRECRGTGRHTPFSTTPRLQLEAATTKENPSMSSNAEAARISQAIEFAAGIAEGGHRPDIHLGAMAALCSRLRRRVGCHTILWSLIEDRVVALDVAPDHRVVWHWNLAPSDCST
jgi:hypothetical protein